jgi:membrane protease YdiL (CAAX protease family)
MDSKYLATHGFALFCFLLALYLSLGGWLQYRFGLGGIVLSEVAFLLIPGLLYTKILGLSWEKYFPLRSPKWNEVLATLLLTAVVIAPIEVLLHYQEQFFPLPQQIQTFYENLTRREVWWRGPVQFFALALIPAVCEELFFRGLLQGLFEPRFGVFKSILLTAFFFAVAHVNPWYLAYYFLLGVFFSWLKYWRGNLVLCILAHLMNNLYSLYG